MSPEPHTGKVVSADGTVIAFDRLGDGPPLVLVLGAFNDRSTHQTFAVELASYFTVFSYDRRGRGGSGDAPVYSVDAEIADLAAIVAQAPSAPVVFGYSSGAVLALAATAAGVPVSGLALYEPPPIRADEPFAERLDRLVAAGQRGAAVELFQTDVIGIPESVVSQLRNAPFRPALEAMAHTLVYEMTILGGVVRPADSAAAVSVPTVVMVGEQSPPLLHESAAAIASANALFRLQVLAGQNHDIVPEVVALALKDQFLQQH
ncbi:MAG: alpha/beta hydrolase [Nocardia sp.]|uniref:alpha/beta fold hydrolase n=1 Tax=Nocardia sp. TaxID=1821 RepID=UPI0026180817|nr:alpha/beta hydrolase [Nocardia sp.]MCU1640152.1 alpha/beta hydrolase [Nocardia sp.]